MAEMRILLQGLGDAVTRRTRKEKNVTMLTKYSKIQQVLNADRVCFTFFTNVSNFRYLGVKTVLKSRQGTK